MIPSLMTDPQNNFIWCQEILFNRKSEMCMNLAICSGELKMYLCSSMLNNWKIINYLGKICSPFLESGLIFWETTSTNCCHCLYRYVHDWSSFINFTLAKQLQVCINNLYQNLNYAYLLIDTTYLNKGPHHSPEKPVQTNTYDYIISLIPIPLWELNGYCSSFDQI